MRKLLFAVLAVAALCAFVVRASQSSRVAGYTPDIAPKEWDGPEQVWAPCKTGVICSGDTVMLLHHIACEDKSRFLLQSEDNKWHCLKFWPDEIKP